VKREDSTGTVDGEGSFLVYTAVEIRKLGDQTGLGTLVVLSENHENQTFWCQCYRENFLPGEYGYSNETQSN